MSQICKVCKIEKEKSKFQLNALRCCVCDRMVRELRYEGYSTEETVEKMEYGSDKQSRIDYWTTRLKRDNKC